ncbi:MAG TPA: ABC transporter permease [Dehalococcoidia bacterium]|nr:ABC transporter permease [Dehalococcoidia bacterium]
MTTTTIAQPPMAPSALTERRNLWRGLWRFTARRPVGAAAGLICILLIFVAIFAHQLAPSAPDALFPTAKLKPPSAAHPFGTDNLFRDMFSRILIGSQISLGVGFASVFVGTLLGTLFGLVGGYARGWADMAINRVIDTVMAFPPLVLAIFFLSIFHATFFTVSMAIGIIIAPVTARIVRGAVLSVVNLQYIEAARALGSSHTRLMFRHVLPNVSAPIIVIASIQIGNAILAEAALSFLSLGIATDAHPSWGKMLQDSRSVWEQAWWTAVIPGVAISIAVLAFNMFGDALRDALDPRLRGS